MPTGENRPFPERMAAECDSVSGSAWPATTGRRPTPRSSPPSPTPTRPGARLRRRPLDGARRAARARGASGAGGRGVPGLQRLGRQHRRAGLHPRPPRRRDLRDRRPHQRRRVRRRRALHRQQADRRPDRGRQAAPRRTSSARSGASATSTTRRRASSRSPRRPSSARSTRPTRSRRPGRRRPRRAVCSCTSTARAWPTRPPRSGSRCAPSPPTPGVDVVSFGATKNGGARRRGRRAAWTPPSRRHARFARKQALQLASKMRFVSAQIVALLDGDLWLRSAAPRQRDGGPAGGRRPTASRSSCRRGERGLRAADRDRLRRCARSPTSTCGTRRPGRSAG